MPHLAASGCVHETMPRVLWTTLRRLANLASSREGGGKTESDTASGIFVHVSGTYLPGFLFMVTILGMTLVTRFSGRDVFRRSKCMVSYSGGGGVGKGGGVL